jgi:hypothetical protein
MDFRGSTLRIYNDANDSRSQISYDTSQLIINADAGNETTSTQIALRIDNAPVASFGTSQTYDAINFITRLSGAFLVQDSDDSNAELFRVSPNNFDFQTGLLKATNTVFEYDGNTVFHSGNATQFSASADQNITGNWTFDGSNDRITVGAFTRFGRGTTANVSATENQGFVGTAWNSTFGFGNMVYRTRSNSSGASHVFFAGVAPTAVSDATFTINSGNIVSNKDAIIKGHCEIRDAKELRLFNSDSTLNSRLARFDAYSFIDNNAVEFRVLDTSNFRLQLTGNFTVEDADDSNAEIFKVSPTEARISSSAVFLDSLPTSAPATSGQIWNDSGTLKIS